MRVVNEVPIGPQALVNGLATCSRVKSWGGPEWDSGSKRHDGELVRHRRTTGSRMDSIRSQIDAQLLTRRTPTERLRAFPDSRNQTSHPPPALLHGPEQIADLPVPVAESPGAVRIGHPERSHLVEYLAPNSVFNSLPRQRSSPHLRPDDRLVTIDRVLHHASLGVA